MSQSGRVVGANDDTVRVKGVVDRRAFAEKLRVAGDAEYDGVRQLGMRFDDAFPHQRLHQVSGSDRHRGLVHDDAEPGGVHRGADAAGRAFEVREI